MKKLSIEEKAKAYDESLIRGSRLWESDVITRESYEYIFPELKELDDEKIKEQVVYAINQLHVCECTKNKLLAWVEKQGEQKPVDRVEPKFKVGDWCIDIEDGTIFQIVKVLDNTYTYKTIEGTEYSCSHYSLENDARLWTIQDAKDGDVLAFYSEYRGNKMIQVGIIEKYVGQHGGCSNTFKIYVGVNWDNNLQIGKYMGCPDIRPATKEQRGLLFSKMKEAGYEWDAEKKELKKIEQNAIEPDDLIEESYQQQAEDLIDMVTEKPAWSEEDDKCLSTIIAEFSKCSEKSVSKDEWMRCNDFLNSIKDKVQQRQEWSEDTQQWIDAIIKDYEGWYDADKDHRATIQVKINILKSIRPQKTWKPTDEQIKLLREVQQALLGKDCHNRFVNFMCEIKRLREE